MTSSDNLGCRTQSSDKPIKDVHLITKVSGKTWLKKIHEAAVGKQSTWVLHHHRKDEAGCALEDVFYFRILTAYYSSIIRQCILWESGNWVSIRLLTNGTNQSTKPRRLSVRAPFPLTTCGHSPSRPSFLSLSSVLSSLTLHHLLPSVHPRPPTHFNTSSPTIF